MARYPEKLARPPIREALLDIRMRVPPRADWDARLAQVQEDLAVDYPNARDVRRVETHVHLTDAAATATGRAVRRGRIFWAKDGNRAVQARIDGFTLNVTRDYPGWDAFLAASRAAWTTVAECLEPSEISRVGLRFINEIRIPVDDDLGTWLQVGPTLPSALPKAMQEFRLRVVLQLREGVTGVLMVGVSAVPEGQSAGLLTLDVDVFTEGQWSASGEGIWEELGRLRLDKNRCFFESLQQQRWQEFT